MNIAIPKADGDFVSPLFPSVAITAVTPVIGVDGAWNRYGTCVTKYTIGIHVAYCRAEEKTGSGWIVLVCRLSNDGTNVLVHVNIRTNMGTA